MKLLVFKEYSKKMYAQNSLFILPAFKVLATFLTLLILSFNIGFMDILKHPLIIIVISLLCAFLPQNLILTIIAAVFTGHLYALSMEMAMVVLIIFVLMFMLYFRFVPKQALVVLLIPVLFFLRIPYVLPIILGLIATPFSVVSLIFGTVIYFIFGYVNSNLDYLNSMSDDAGLQKVVLLLKAISINKAMWITIIAFSVVLVTVYIIRRLSVDHSWNIAVSVGGILNIIIMLVGYLMFGLDKYISIPAIIFGGIISIGLAFLIQFLVLTVDYTRTEYTQFEDEEYYYYVKAVPKVSVSTPNISVKRINARRASKNINK